MILRTSTLLAFTLALAAAGCSSSPSTTPASGVAAPGPAFAKYCTGTLKVDKPLMHHISGGWEGDGSLHAPAGSTILVAVDFDHWQGFVIQGNGAPAETDADFSTGLVKDTDFTSDCATDAKLAAPTHTVLLADSTFFPNADATGTACTLPVGTELTNYTYSGFGDAPATVTAAEIKATCGLDKAYSKDMAYGSLVAR